MTPTEHLKAIRAAKEEINDLYNDFVKMHDNEVRKNQYSDNLQWLGKDLEAAYSNLSAAAILCLKHIASLDKSGEV